MPQLRIHPVAEARAGHVASVTADESQRFVPAGTYLVPTMSCFLCGRHRPRTRLKTRRFFGRARQVCEPSCEES